MKNYHLLARNILSDKIIEDGKLDLVAILIMSAFETVNHKY